MIKTLVGEAAIQQLLDCASCDEAPNSNHTLLPQSHTTTDGLLLKRNRTLLCTGGHWVDEQNVVRCREIRARSRLLQREEQDAVSTTPLLETVENRRLLEDVLRSR